MAIAGNNDTERLLMKRAFFGGAVLLTFSLGCLNVYGAWVGTGGVGGKMGLVPYTSLAAGAEIMLFVAVGLLVTAPTRLRQGIAALVILGLTYFCVENGKFAIEHSFRELFVENSASLTKKADLLEASVPALEAGQGAAVERDQVTLAGLREQIARLEAERELMASSTNPATIAQAQTALQSMGYYAGNIDGIYEELTKSAMLRRGGEVTRELDLLKRQERTLSGAGSSDEGTKLEDIGAAAIALTPAQEAKAAVIELRTKAAEVSYRERWMTAVLWIVELARTLGVWAFLMTGTAAGTTAARNGNESSGPLPTETPKPAAPPPPPEPDPIPEPVAEVPEPIPEPVPEPEPEPVSEIEPLLQAAAFVDVPEAPKASPARKGGLATQHGKRAAKARIRIPIDDFDDADMEQAEGDAA